MRNLKKSDVKGFFEKKLDFFFIIQKVNDRCIHVVQLFVKSCWRQFEMIKLTFREVLYKASIIYEYNMVVCGNGGGINVYIICIVTLFLAEYCGFGWVVGTFVWIFWFCFRNRLKMLYFHFFKSSLENLPGVVVGLRPPRIPRQIFKRTLKKNENITFSSDCEKKSKYQKKVPTISQIHNISQKNVTIYIIFLIVRYLNTILL